MRKSDVEIEIALLMQVIKDADFQDLLYILKRHLYMHGSCWKENEAQESIHAEAVHSENLVLCAKKLMKPAAQFFYLVDLCDKVMSDDKLSLW